MTLQALLKESRAKAVPAMISAVAVALMWWIWAATSSWFASLVHAEEMEGFVGMVIAGLDPRLSGIESQLEATKAATSRNSADLTRSRIQSIDTAMRDLRVEIQAMEADKEANPAAWGRGSANLALLEEWQRDLADLSCEKVTLLQPNEMHLECL